MNTPSWAKSPEGIQQFIELIEPGFSVHDISEKFDGYTLTIGIGGINRLGVSERKRFYILHHLLSEDIEKCAKDFKNFSEMQALKFESENIMEKISELEIRLSQERGRLSSNLLEIEKLRALCLEPTVAHEHPLMKSFLTEKIPYTVLPDAVSVVIDEKNTCTLRADKDGALLYEVNGLVGSLKTMNDFLSLVGFIYAGSDWGSIPAKWRDLLPPEEGAQDA